MSDDIVTRLRGQFSNAFIINHPNMVRVPTLYEEAADEIERLRAENRQQGKAIQIMGERWTLCEQCQEINRRGW